MKNRKENMNTTLEMTIWNEPAIAAKNRINARSLITSRKRKKANCPAISTIQWLLKPI